MSYSAPAFGIQPTGFVKKLVTDIQLDIAARAQGPSGVDPNLDLAPTEPMGQVMGIAAAEIAEGWEILETLYNSLDPNSAEDFLLDAVCALTGTKRPGATYSTCVCTLNLNASTTIAAGTVANVTGQAQNTWTLIGPADANGNLVVQGPVVSTTSGNYQAYFRSTTTGPNIANAGTLTVVASPPAGLNSITNAASATVGSLKSTDTQLRTLRQNELSAAGSGTIDAIRAKVLLVSGVKQAFVYENTLTTTDSFGRPPKSIEVVIFDGATPNHTIDNAVAQAMWNSKPAGTPYYSATGDSGTAVDSLNANQTVVFSRATVVPIYVTATTTPAATSLTAPTIKAGWAAWALANVGLGSELYALAFRGAVLPNLGETNPFAVTGLLDVPTFAFDIVASPTNTGNLVATVRQFFYVTTANITVNGF